MWKITLSRTGQQLTVVGLLLLGFVLSVGSVRRRHHPPPPPGSQPPPPGGGPATHQHQPAVDVSHAPARCIKTCREGLASVKKDCAKGYFGGRYCQAVPHYYNGCLSSCMTCKKNTFDSRKDGAVYGRNPRYGRCNCGNFTRWDYTQRVCVDKDCKKLKSTCHRHANERLRDCWRNCERYPRRFPIQLEGAYRGYRCAKRDFNHICQKKWQRNYKSCVSQFKFCKKVMRKRHRSR